MLSNNVLNYALSEILIEHGLLSIQGLFEWKAESLISHSGPVNVGRTRLIAIGPVSDFERLVVCWIVKNV